MHSHSINEKMCLDEGNLTESKYFLKATLNQVINKFH